MFFLLRVAFWLTLVLVLLPSGSSKPAATASIGATEAMVAAGAAVSDVSNFCDRQPGACAVGAQAAATIGQRAQAGAKMVYEFISDQMARSETGSVPESKSTHTVPASPGSQTTLKASDLEPAWQGPAERTEIVPLPRPRKDPRRQA